MVMIQTGSRKQSASTDVQDSHQAGPVFVPPRRPSAFARQLIQESAGTGDAVTAYDELWFAGRPTV